VTVLVVDDRPAVADAYASRLFWTYTTRAAYTGEEAPETVDEGVERQLRHRLRDRVPAFVDLTSKFEALESQKPDHELAAADGIETLCERAAQVGADIEDVTENHEDLAIELDEYPIPTRSGRSVPRWSRRRLLASRHRTRTCSRRRTSPGVPRYPCRPASPVRVPRRCSR